MNFLNTVKAFAANESGAVTVDWVVLTAAIVGLGLAVVTSVSTGVGSVGTQISNALGSVRVDSIGTVGFSGTPATE